MPDGLDQILPIKRISREAGDYIVKCPHCGKVISVEGDDLSEMKDAKEQYQHTVRTWVGGRTVGCGGWFEITDDTRYVKEL